MPINSFLYPGAKVTSAYEVSNSVRFDDGSGDELTRSQSSSPSSQRLFTFSAWVKRGNLNSGGSDANMQFFSQHNDTTDRMDFRFQSGDTIDFFHNSPRCRITTNRLFRDISSWYHVCLRVDTTQSTAANRIRLYINGVQETSFSSADYGDQNDDLGTNYSTFDVGDGSFGTEHFDGYMCEVVYCDGQSLDPTSFGEFDSDSPNIWKPIDVSGLTFGTNGFYLQFKQSGTSANSSGIGADTSGNDNHFTVNNLTAVDQSTDTCTNNFATFNPLKFSFEDSAVRDPTYSEGNLVALHHESGHKCPAFSTLAANSGKWYCEVKWLAVNGSYPVNQYTGVVNIDASVTRNWNVLGYFYRGDGTQYVVGSGSSFGATYTTNDIIGIFMDLDNNKLYFSKNGAMQNSGDPTSGSTGTGAISLATNIYYAFMTEDYNNGKTSINFGSPEFSISSGNSDPNGYGNFEYDPQGYYALNTKNLAEFG